MIEREEQSSQEASFAFHSSAKTALSTPEPGVEQFPHGVTEHV